jgi:hypothetical protein
MVDESSKIHKQWESYLAGVETAIGQELDENTRRELKWAYLAGAVACFGLMVQATKAGPNEHGNFVQEMANVGFDLGAEMRNSGYKLPVTQ